MVRNRCLRLKNANKILYLVQTTCTNHKVQTGNSFVIIEVTLDF